ncbi:MAG: hypothetical protein HC924_00765 [Synechococcaceae cyanobacterium SM2_3_2]|nr:hypothetical protein [Synechococcaceae cyanobacterium SM2_3_2]
MLGSFQQSTLRLEMDASAATLERCLKETALLRQWLWPQQLQEGIPEQLQTGIEFESWIGPVRIGHRVEQCFANQLQVSLWGGVDGMSEWVWGNGWAQLRVEAISLMPLSPGVLLSLGQLQAFAPQLTQSTTST